MTNVVQRKETPLYDDGAILVSGDWRRRNEYQHADAISRVDAEIQRWRHLRADNGNTPFIMADLSIEDAYMRNKHNDCLLILGGKNDAEKD